MGECPDWYPLMRAARYMKVAPWELADKPICWQNWANIAEFAEDRADAEKQNRAQKRAAAKGGGRRR